MFEFIKKLLGMFCTQKSQTTVEVIVPYKVEAPVNPQITDAVTTTTAPAIKAVQPAKAPAAQQKRRGRKPQGQKPATQTATPATQPAQKPAGQKRRGRKPKSKPQGQ